MNGSHSWTNGRFLCVYEYLTTIDSSVVKERKHACLKDGIDESTAGKHEQFLNPLSTGLSKMAILFCIVQVRGCVCVCVCV